MSQGDSEGYGTEVKRVLLGAFLYNIPVIVAFVAIAGWYGYSVEGRGILRGWQSRFTEAEPMFLCFSIPPLILFHGLSVGTQNPPPLYLTIWKNEEE